MMDLPGPGAYDPRDHYVKSSTKSFKIMNPSRSVTNTEMQVKGYLPGPGQYTPEKHALSSHVNLPKWTMGNKNSSSGIYARLEKIHGNNPAPGNYDLNRSLGEGPKVNYLYKYYLF